MKAKISGTPTNVAIAPFVLAHPVIHHEAAPGDPALLTEAVYATTFVSKRYVPGVLDNVKQVILSGTAFVVTALSWQPFANEMKYAFPLTLVASLNVCIPGPPSMINVLLKAVDVKLSSV